MHPLPDSQNPDSLVEVCRLLSPSGFYPLVSWLLPPPLLPFYPMHCRCVDLGVCLPLSIRLSKGYSLPIRSNRISWKLKNDHTVFCLEFFQSFPLPIRSNRISWKHLLTRKTIHSHQLVIQVSLPIRSNRISWKRFKNIPQFLFFWESLPIRSNRISWKRSKGIFVILAAFIDNTLPIRSNRISWKAEKGFLKETLFLINPVK
jgi:hypothetical protein